MKILPDDPRITAYALGEIEDETERSAIEAAVEQSPELQKAVVEIQKIGELLTSEFAEETAVKLNEFEKERMLQSTKQSRERRSGINRSLLWPALSSIAAVLVVALVMFNAGVVDSGRQHAVVEEIPSETLNFDGDTSPLDNLTAYDEVDMVTDSLPQQMPEAELSEIVDVGSAPVVAKQHTVFSKPVSPPAAKQSFESPIPAVVDAIEFSGAPPRQRAFSDSFAESCFTPKPLSAWNMEKYASIEESDFRSPLVAPLSTFSIDVDTASYANVRRFLNQGQLPPADAVRIEELINYFTYTDAAPTQSPEAGGVPFSVHMAQTTAPWSPSNHLLRIALKGYEMPWEDRPASNLVFLLDVSGSMSDSNKLPLVKEAMDILISRLDERDRVAIVVYAGASGLALPSTTANNRETIRHALNNLEAGGSTNGGVGIQLAYKVAREHFIDGGNNRVILCTDGDFNIGQTNSGDLADLAEAAADDGISLTILGFGMGNYKDDLLEDLSNKGKGSYAYIDSGTEAQKVFLQDLTGNLFKIAKDVKIQVEFNPAKVKKYRLIGYENRRLKAEDFNNDKKKAGDIGPGHTVVALYEVILANDDEPDLLKVDDLRYQHRAEISSTSTEVATVKLRYKNPDADVSQLITQTVSEDALTKFDEASEDVRFSASVAAFGLLLSDSEHANGISYQTIETIASNALGVDSGGYRSEFVGLVRQARKLSETSNVRGD